MAAVTAPSDQMTTRVIVSARQAGRGLPSISTSTSWSTTRSNPPLTSVTDTKVADDRTREPTDVRDTRDTRAADTRTTGTRTGTVTDGHTGTEPEHRRP